MKSIKPLSIVAMLTLPLSACAIGEPIAGNNDAFPAIAKGKARITVFRSQFFGAAIQPTILVSGQETGMCTHNGAFFIDVAPGKHLLSAETSGRDFLAVQAVAGQTSYVECQIKSGFPVGQPELEVVDSTEGEAHVERMVLTGSYQAN